MGNLQDFRVIFVWCLSYGTIAEYRHYRQEIDNKVATVTTLQAKYKQAYLFNLFLFFSLNLEFYTVLQLLT